MDLTWKDKLSYYSQELRSNLPFSDEPKKQYAFLGILVGLILIFLFVWTFLFVANKNDTKAAINYGINGQTGENKGGSSGKRNNNSQSGNGQGVVTSNQQQTILPITPASGGAAGSKTQQQNNSTDINGSQTKGTGPSSYSKFLTGTIPPPQELFPTTTTSRIETGNSSGSSSNSQNSSGGSTGNTNSNNPTPTNIPLFFPDPTGNLQPYITPTAAPSGLSWATYINLFDRYTIEIPIGWQVIRTFYNGHEGVSIYPPGIDPTMSMQDGLKAIGFGVSQYGYQVPYINSSQASYTAPITVDNYSGTLYTQGIFGSNTIAVILKYGSYYFAIGGTANSDDMIYVFQHMIGSLNLYGAY